MGALFRERGKRGSSSLGCGYDDFNASAGALSGRWHQTRCTRGHDRATPAGLWVPGLAQALVALRERRAPLWLRGHDHQDGEACGNRVLGKSP